MPKLPVLAGAEDARTSLLQRHPELVSGSIPRFDRGKRGQPQPHGKVRPMWVRRIDEIDLPRPVPVLELLLARDRSVHVAEHFEVDETVDFVAAGESRQSVVAMLPKPCDQIGRHADVERAERLARKDVDARDTFLPHGPVFGARWTLKQVQGDEEGMGLEVVSSTTLYQPRHAELVSATIVPHTWRMSR